jgi:hypothetical protein
LRGRMALRYSFVILGNQASRWKGGRTISLNLFINILILIDCF